MPGVSNAVFLSYASEDAEAAERIATALRTAGVEVWFDKSELRGGDAWDQSIRDQINACALFVPLISANAHARVEGYFRLEWKLAIDRSHRMAPKQPFLVPVVIDDTRRSDSTIPDRFRDLQWTHLPAGEATSAFVDRVTRLLAPEPSGTASVTHPTAAAPSTGAAMTIRGPLRARWRSKAVLLGILAVGIAGLGYLAADRWLRSKQLAETRPTSVPAAQAAAPGTASFNPPPRSIAVLPFVNMSGDKEQEYFSDGLSEELLNDLARISELQVAARTSAFAFKGKDTDIGTVARKLNVAAVLEGSVRRSAHKIRVTAQLINAVTGFHLWSETYDRDLGDVLNLQTEIAAAVAAALKVKLLGDVAAEMRIGGTRSAAAYDAYLRATSAYWQVSSAADNESVRADYQEAVRLDPNFALAYAGWSIALSAYALNYAHGPEVSDGYRQARTQALKAIALAPELAEGRLAMAIAQAESLDFAGATDEFQRATTLAPGSARVLRDSGSFAVSMGRTDAGIAAVRRATTLDPLNASSQSYLRGALWFARRYDEALAAYQDAVALRPDDPDLRASGWPIYYVLGDFEKMRTVCQGVEPAEVVNLQDCLALAYRKLGRQAEAETALARFKALRGDAGAFAYAEIYAQWGDTREALTWLETALRLVGPGLIYLKTDPYLDPLRKEPRFQAIERELKFPQ
jgi:TolB-like protein/Tfp pilus assembly protein PilF